MSLEFVIEDAGTLAIFNKAFKTCPSCILFLTGPFEENGKLINDQVTCFKCGHLFREWEEDDDPLAEHRSIYPQCFEVSKFCHT